MIKISLAWLTSLSLAHGLTFPQGPPRESQFVKTLSEVNRTYVPAEVARTLEARYTSKADRALITEHLRRAEDVMRKNKVAFVTTGGERGELRVGDHRVARIEGFGTSLKINGKAVDPRAKTYAEFVKSVERAVQKDISWWPSFVPRAEAASALFFVGCLFAFWYCLDQASIASKRQVFTETTDDLTNAVGTCDEASRRRAEEQLHKLGEAKDEAARRADVTEDCAVQVARYEVRTKDRDATAERILYCHAVVLAERCVWPELARLAPGQPSAPPSAK